MAKKSLILLYSDPNILAINILNELIENNFLVYVITPEVKKWQEKKIQIKSKVGYLICSLKEFKLIPSFDYAIFCGGFSKKATAPVEFKKFLTLNNFGNAKILALFPSEIAINIKANNIEVTKNSGILFLGDLLGEGMDLNSDLFVPTLISRMIGKRTLTLAVGEQFFPLLLQDATKFIVKTIPGTDLYGHKTFLLGNRIISSVFWKLNTKYFKDLKVVYDTKMKPREFPRQIKSKIIKSNLSEMLEITYRWILKKSNIDQSKKLKPAIVRTLPTSKVVISPSKVSKKIADLDLKNKIKRFKSNKFVRIAKFIVLTSLFLPVLTTIAATLILFLAYRNFLANNIELSQKTSLMAKTVFVIGGTESKVLGNVPLIGIVYREIGYVSYLGENISDTFAYTAPALKETKLLLDHILGTNSYDVKSTSTNIKNGLVYVLSKTNNIHITSKTLASENVNAAKQVLNLIDFDKLKIVIEEMANITNNLPQILGSEKKMQYLLLFQNNMELRPTGGFIGSFGLTDFTGGKMSSLTVNDIYSADGQLKGHIEPPSPIKKYLGEANWWFRDSNWSPDFTTSAQRAEWFLNKELGQQVSGTLAIDLYPVKSMLQHTGPIFLPDYNLTISAENLYEKTQQESQANFFPGSRKKASFLTALSRALINEIPKLNSKQKIAILKSVYDGLNGRNIQLYLHNENLQKSIEKLSWAGNIPVYACGNGCYSDFFGNVEANLGVNKSNYFISRSFNLDASIENNKLVRRLNIKLENSANPLLGPSGQYKTYLRVLIPTDAKVSNVGVTNGDTQSNLTPDISLVENVQEVGVYVEILPGQSRTVKLEWESDIAKIGNITSYGLFVRKQAGTGTDPISIKFKSETSEILSQPVFSLTDKGTYTYNTNLSKDFFARLTFK